ncbi:uncharacterized protein [Equus caballus]|uniref:uncharacterized protein n=1 Tax=Equus caballus TaxID=9796 RepID=UPI0038B3DD31
MRTKKGTLVWLNRRTRLRTNSYGVTTRHFELHPQETPWDSPGAPPSELTPAVRSRPGAAPPTLPRGSAPTGRTLGAGAGPPCSASWAQRRLWTEHAHQRPPRRLRARARALASRSWRRDLRSGRAPGGSRAAVPTGLPRFGGLSDEPRRPEMFRLERHFPEGSGHSRSSASIPCSRGSPSLQALDSLCSFPVEESQGGLISFGGLSHCSNRYKILLIGCIDGAFSSSWWFQIQRKMVSLHRAWFEQQVNSSSLLSSL